MCVCDAAGSCADVMHSAKRFQNGFPEKMVSIILRDVVEGLRYLHRLGFVHRSIRAKHFLIHQSGTVKLAGLRTMIPMVEHGERVHVLHHHSPATVENICWLAPEVLAQDLEGYSSKSDVYSVGIAALELATGEAPFAGLPVTEVCMLVCVCSACMHVCICALCAYGMCSGSFTVIACVYPCPSPCQSDLPAEAPRPPPSPAEEAVRGEHLFKGFLRSC